MSLPKNISDSFDAWTASMRALDALSRDIDPYLDIHTGSQELLTRKSNVGMDIYPKPLSFKRKPIAQGVSSHHIMAFEKGCAMASIRAQSYIPLLMKIHAAQNDFYRHLFDNFSQKTYYPSLLFSFSPRAKHRVSWGIHLWSDKPLARHQYNSGHTPFSPYPNTLTPYIEPILSTMMHYQDEKSEQEWTLKDLEIHDSQISLYHASSEEKAILLGMMILDPLLLIEPHQMSLSLHLPKTRVEGIANNALLPHLSSNT